MRGRLERTSDTRTGWRLIDFHSAGVLRKETRSGNEFTTDRAVSASWLDATFKGRTRVSRQVERDLGDFELQELRRKREALALQRRTVTPQKLERGQISARAALRALNKLVATSRPPAEDFSLAKTAVAALGAYVRMLERAEKQRAR
jgi:hypothetical protein